MSKPSCRNFIRADTEAKRPSVGLPKKQAPTYPGEMLREEFLLPLGIYQTEFARALDVSFKTVNELVNEKSSVSTEMAMRLAQVLGTSAELWLNMQQSFNLWQTAQSGVASSHLFKEGCVNSALG